MRSCALLLALALAASIPASLSVVAAADPYGSPSTSAAVPAPSAQPAELVGSWFTGSISSIQYYDTINHTWNDPGGEGFYLILDPDGTYEEGAVIQSQVYGCEMRLLGRAVGGWSVEGYQLWLQRETGETTVVGNCSRAGGNTMEPQVDIYYWELGPDDYGLETLSLKLPDMSPYVSYRRWDA